MRDTIDRMWPPPAKLTVDGEPEPRELRPLDIVVIEDNDDFRALMVDLLRLDGHRVSAAADGMAGLRLALRDPDLTFVDIHLPQVDGYRIARKVRAAGCEGYLVAMTGFGQSHDRASAVAVGFDDYIVKPARKPRIADAIERARAVRETRAGARRHRRARTSSRAG